MSEDTQQVAVQIPSTTEVMANPEMLNAIQNKAKSLGEQAVADMVVYLKMTKAGDWVHGEEEDDIDEDAVFVINPLSYQYGAVAFSDNKFVDEKLVSAFGSDPIPLAEDLEEEFPIDKIEASDGWKAQHGIMMVSVEGGPNLIFKASSVGGIRELETLIGKVAKRMETNPESFFPVVNLDCDSYKHKKYGKIFTPIINVVAWASNDSAEIVEEVDAE